jgi:hypothetical protein
MTGGGLFILVAYGSQNVILSGNPQMTYFYKVFRRYSHFSMENVIQQMDGPDELFFDQNIQVRSKIQRIGDLMSDMYFTFRLPDIYSKYTTTRPGVPKYQYEFAWTRYIGAAIINNVAFFIGGQKIQEFDGTYLLSKALVDYPTEKYNKWRILVGDVPELSDPGNGVYAGGSTQTGYPTVIKDSARDTGAQINRPSIFGQLIHVPLPFWFAENEGSSLPLVGLQYHDCEVQIKLNSINQLYTVLDASGYRVRPSVQTLAPQVAINSNNPEYATVNDLSGELRSFLTDIGSFTPALNTWSLQPSIQCTYVYLPEEERSVFASTPLSYLVHQVTPYNFPTLFNRQLLDIEVHNPIERLLYVTRRSDTLQYRNAFENFTNWFNYPDAPYLPPGGATALTAAAYSSGTLLPNAQLGILQSLRILCDGNEIQEEKPVDFFTKITPFRYTSGNANTNIPVYTFSLTSPGTQPAGSINASRIRVFQTEINPFPLPIGTNYVYDLTIYVENINFLEITGGMGGLKYAL